jgi:hypothetical protein
LIARSKRILREALRLIGSREAAVTDIKVDVKPVDDGFDVEGGWKTYKPIRPPDAPAATVKVQHVRLLTSQADIEARTTAAEVAAFLREAERLAGESFWRSSTRFVVTVEFTCRPGGHAVQLAHEGDTNLGLLQHYYGSLRLAKKMPVDHGEVRIQMELSISP